MWVVQPKEGERYYLKMILNYKKGATCWQDLYTHDGTIYDTFF